MIGWIISILVPVGGYYLYHSDKGEILLALVRLYDYILRYIVRPVRTRLQDNSEITAVYCGEQEVKLSDVLDGRYHGKYVEVFWKGRYRTIFNGADVELTTPFTTVNQRVNILYAQLHKYEEDDIITMTDVSILIDQYAGPDGDFFYGKQSIFNEQANFYYMSNGVRRRMLEDKRDYISLMNKAGEEIELKL